MSLQELGQGSRSEKFQLAEALPIPIAFLTVTETPDGPLVRPLTADDERRRDLRIDVYEDRLAGGDAVALALLHEIVRFSRRAVVLPADTTHQAVYPRIISRAVELDVNLREIDWLHLDNYNYPPEEYSQGPDEFDFARYLETQFIQPAGIPRSRFHPIDSWKADPEMVAQRYDELFRQLQPQVGLFGLGPVGDPEHPEVHLAYISAGTPLDRGYHYLPRLPEHTISRNRERGEMTPDGAISMGPDNIRSLGTKFVSAWGKPDEVTAALLGPITLETVATMLRRPGFRNGTQFFLDQASAKPLLAQLN